MPIELNIITAKEFVRLGTHGEIDWNTSRTVLRKLAQELVKRGTDLALVDLRDASTILTYEQLPALVEVFHKMGFTPRHRLAILFRRTPTAKAPVFAALASYDGMHVAAFDSYEQCVEWLSLNETDENPPPRTKRAPKKRTKG